MLYQQIVSDKLRIEIKRELQENLDSKKFVCKSKEEFMKKEEEKKYPESIQNLEENKKKLENEEVEFEQYLRKLKK